MSRWRWTAAVLVVVMAGAVLAAGPKLKSSWRNMDPKATPVSKLIVIGFTKEQATRRSMEDSLAAEIVKNGGTAEPSYLLVPGPLPKEPVDMKARITAAGYDGAVVVRVAGVSQEQSWEPNLMPVMPTYYYSPWSYWDYWYPYAWDPFYLRTDTIVRIETVVYSIRSDVMLWTGLSESTNPGSVRKLIQEVAVAAGADIKQRNVLR
jgi:hypothetical protein